MADSKDYWASTEDRGSVRISEDVIASIAALASLEVPGVHSLSSHFGADIAELLGKKTLSRGVKIQFDRDFITVDICFLVKHGYIINDVAKQVQEKVSGAIDAMTGLKTTAVNVHITGVFFEPEEPSKPEEGKK